LNFSAFLKFPPKGRKEKRFSPPRRNVPRRSRAGELERATNGQLSPSSVCTRGRGALFFLLCALLCLSVACFQWGAAEVSAQAERPPNTHATSQVHIVQPGETLFSIAEHYGVEPGALRQLNQLASPRELYPGQVLHVVAIIEGVDISAWQAYPVSLGEDMASLARYHGTTWKIAGKANRMLRPGNLPIGQMLRLPPRQTFSSVAVVQRGDTPLILALRHDQPWWELQRLNSQPLHTGALVLLPGEEVSSTLLPAPITALSLTPQPVPQGRAVLLTIETSVPATCEIAYLDYVEHCFQDNTTQLYAWLGFPPLLEPGRYQIALQINADEQTIDLSLPLNISEGRFSFERIDLPPDRQRLFDPGLSQAERNKIAALRGVRTPERYWKLPFDFPLDAEVSSYFGSRRAYGGMVFNSYHAGVDFNANEGTEIHAPAAGTVVLADPLVVRGNAVMLDHGWGVLSGYWHLSQIDVEVGQHVSLGQVIGRVGNTGLSTGAHLHWEMWVNGVAVDPLQWVEPGYTFPELAAPGKLDQDATDG